MDTTEATWEQLLPKYYEHLNAGTLSPRTVELRKYHLGRIRKYLTAQHGDPEPGDVTPDMLNAYSAPHPDWKPNTRAVVRAAMSGFWGWAHENEFIAKNPVKRMPKIKVPAGVPKPASDLAYAGALEKASDRVQLMVFLGALAGLRAMEIAGLHSEHVELEHDTDGNELWSLRITGKGSKTRLIPINAELAGMLRAKPYGYIFPGRDNGHVSPAYVSRLVSKVLPPGVTCHKLRHRFATRALRASNNLLAVKELLGHASVATTQGYVQVSNETLRTTALSANAA